MNNTFTFSATNGVSPFSYSVIGVERVIDVTDNDIWQQYTIPIIQVETKIKFISSGTVKCDIDDIVVPR